MNSLRPPLPAPQVNTALPPLVQQANDPWLSGAQVCARQGNLHRATLWRWIHGEVGFPPPDDTINGRNYWKLSTILRWEAERAAERLSETEAA